MNHEIEKQIISFLDRQKRERAEYALANPKKRQEFIWNLSHYFDLRYIYLLDQAVDSPKIVCEKLKGSGAPNECYILSTNSNTDGKIMPLSEALDKCLFVGGPCVISCIHGHLAYFEGEPIPYSAPERYLLIK